MYRFLDIKLMYEISLFVLSILFLLRNRLKLFFLAYYFSLRFFVKDSLSKILSYFTFFRGIASQQRVIIFMIFFFFTQRAIGQVITSTPTFPKASDSVVVNFNAAQGTGGLKGFTGEVYAHVGVITEKSVSPSDWKYVKTNWGENTSETKLMKVSTDVYQLSIGPSIQEYFGVPEGEEILKLAFVFRSADASKEGKADGASDIFLELSSGFTLRVDQPIGRYQFYDVGSVINIDLKTSETAILSYYLDGEKKASEVGTIFTGSHLVLADQNIHKIALSAVTATDSIGFIHTYIVDPTTANQSMPAGLKDGINYREGDDTKVELVLTAPNKKSVFVLGDFNDWSLNRAYQLHQDGDRFWITIEGLEAEKEYIFQYLIDGSILVADPFSEKIISPFDDVEIIKDNRYPNLISYPFDLTQFEASVIQTSAPSYDWSLNDFERPEKEDLVIYELLVRDFTDQRSFQAVLDKLDYLDSLGINAIELMPIMEFEGNLSWGYNPAFEFAVDKYYGTEMDLKKLIDACHQKGIAVILDMVLNHHFGRNSMVRMYSSGDYGPPTTGNPWFNTISKHDYNVGYDINHESAYTQAYVDRVVQYWIEEYHVDGYRFDLSKGFTQKNTLGNVGDWGKYDASRVILLKRLADVIWQVDPKAYVILEHFSENTEEFELADYGMMLWGNLGGTFLNTAMGIPSDLKWSYYKNRGWAQNGLIGYMESHDEERMFYEVANRSDEAFSTQIKRLMQSTAFFLATPGPKMIWQFSEFGYDVGLNEDRLGIKPTKWEYLLDDDRLKIFAVYQAMINLKTQTNYLDDQYFEWASDGDIKWIRYQHPDLDLVLYGNFTKTDQETTRHFTKTGTWYNYLTGKSLEVTDLEEIITLGPSDFGIYTDSPIENHIAWMPENYLLSINDDEENLLELYPNPTEDKISISSKMVFDQYAIFNMEGQLIKKGFIVDQSINIAHLNRGVYLIKVQNTKLMKVKKIVKH